MGDQHKAREAAQAWVAVRPWFVSGAVRAQFLASGEHVQYLDCLTALDVLAIDHGQLQSFGHLRDTRRSLGGQVFQHGQPGRVTELTDQFAHVNGVFSHRPLRSEPTARVRREHRAAGSGAAAP